MNKSSIETFLLNIKGPSHRTLKRKVDEMCKNEHLQQLRNEFVTSNSSDVNSRIDPFETINDSSTRNVYEDPQIHCNMNDYLNELEHIGFQVEYGECYQQRASRSMNSKNNVDNMDLVNSIFEDIQSPDQFQVVLRLWSLKYNIKNKALTALLKILRTNKHPDLPSDARTLKHTPREIVSREVEPGRYWHFGTKRMIETLRSTGIHLPSELTININIDGLPISRSSKSLFWPILGKFVEMKKLKPFVIGIYAHESTKPKNLRSYLYDFVEEMKEFSTQRFCEIQVSAGLFILDAPAMAFVTQTSGHNSRKPCGKCEITGKHIGGRMCYTSIINKKRTDLEFRLRVDKVHHNDPMRGDSSDKEVGEDEHSTQNITTGPLESIPGVDMVYSLAIDSLHVIFLGVTKKELSMNNKKLKFPINDLLRNKLAKTNHNNIHLTLCSAQMNKPSEFHRAIRSLEYLSHYKGTELRNFLLYHGVVALKNHVDPEIYNNFLKLHCAVTICSSDKYRKYIPVAEELFKNYVAGFKKIYGRCMVSYNVHQLLHIAEYVSKFGSLDKYSAFAFESKLGEIANMICSGNNPLQQAANRVVEHLELEIEDFKQLQSQNDTLEPKLGENSIQFPDFRIKNNDRDRWFLTKNKEIVRFDEIKFDANENFQHIIVGRQILNKCEYYQNPSSITFDIYQSDGNLGVPCHWSIGDIENKLFCIQDIYGNQIFFPILHTL